MAFDPLSDALKKHALNDYAAVLTLDPLDPKFPDWTIIISFYMALHTVNAHAAKNGWKWKEFAKDDRNKITRHNQTLRYVSKTFGRETFRKYERLYTECWNARYDPFFLKSIKPSDATDLFKIGEQLLSLV